MTAIARTIHTETYTVIHPLDDVREEKRSLEGIGPMQMSRSVKLSLLALRGYLILMTIMTGVRVVEIVAALGKHTGH